MPPASSKWCAEDDVRKWKSLKAHSGGEDVYIGIGPGLNADQIRQYVDEFIKWANENPSLMEHSISDLSVVFIPTNRPLEYENKNMIRFSFNHRLSGTGYNFEIIDGRLVFVGKNHWQA